MQAVGATGAATANGQPPKVSAPEISPALPAVRPADKAGLSGFSLEQTNYLLAAAAGGFVLSELMPEAAPVGGIAVLEEPELVPELLLEPLLEPLPEGMLEPAGGVDGMVDGLVDGDVDGGLIGAGVVVSSIFLPQAPSASSAESITTVTAGLK